jgi:hypothetical protein
VNLPRLLLFGASLSALLSCTGGEPGGASFPPGEVAASDKTLCAIDHGHCDVNATCADSAAGPICTCKPGFAADGATCVDIATSLGGLRWDLPCGARDGAYGCATAPTLTVKTTLGGDPAKEYSILLRFRGVVELKDYLGGTRDGFWQTGGAPNPAGNANIYALQVSSPAQTYYLNAASIPAQTHLIDYVSTLRATGGAIITMSADSVDASEGINIQTGGTTPIVVPGVPPAPKPYDGQFIQMDIVSVHQ